MKNGSSFISSISMLQTLVSTMNPKMLNNSAEKIGYNPDLLTQILLRIPTKTLLKFKCVSKQWLSLISDPRFCLSHTRHHRRGPTALLLKLQLFVKSFKFDVVPLKHYSKVPFFDYINSFNVAIVQSCNGLLLLSKHFFGGPDYFICNPTTKKFKKLSFPRNPINDLFFHVNLAFDPMISPHYKIVVVVEVSKNEFEIDLYGSETDHWKVSQTVFKADGNHIVFHEPFFCNGKIHWHSCLEEALYFDVDKDCLHTMLMPTRPDTDEYFRYLGEINGILHLALTYYEFNAMALDIYQMASNYSHWSLKYSLDLNNAMEVMPELKLGCDPSLPGPGVSGMTFVGSVEEDEAKVVMWADGKIICYDFKCGQWKMIYDPGLGLKIGITTPDIFRDKHQQRFRTYKYFENLSCI